MTFKASKHAKMENKIEYIEENNELTILIYPLYDKRKQNMLTTWLVLFSLCGLAIISQFFYDYPSSTKLFFVVYLIFWLFFEFKVIYAIRWRKFGKEVITIDKESIYLTKKIGERGVTERYDLSAIDAIEALKHKGKLVYEMSSSYWNSNHYTLCVNINKQQIPFGIDLNGQQAKKLIKTLKETVKNRVENKL